MSERDDEGRRRRRVTCASAVLSTFMNLCMVSVPGLEAGFIVEAVSEPRCIVVRSNGCETVAGACVYLGGIVGGCFGMPEVNHLFSVEGVPEPGEVFFVTFD